MSSSSSSSPLEPSLTRKLLLRRHPDQRFGNDAIFAANELIRLFIVEARQRAAVEAECEDETKDFNGSASLSMLSQSSDDEKDRMKDCVSIKPDHIARVAAELLMDFS